MDVAADETNEEHEGDIEARHRIGQKKRAGFFGSARSAHQKAYAGHHERILKQPVSGQLERTSPHQHEPHDERDQQHHEHLMNRTNRLRQFSMTSIGVSKRHAQQQRVQDHQQADQLHIGRMHGSCTKRIRFVQRIDPRSLPHAVFPTRPRRFGALVKARHRLPVREHRQGGNEQVDHARNDRIQIPHDERERA